jgi:hypothetical protein
MNFSYYWYWLGIGDGVERPLTDLLALYQRILAKRAIFNYAHPAFSIKQN